MTDLQLYYKIIDLLQGKSLTSIDIYLDFIHKGLDVYLIKIDEILLKLDVNGIIERNLDSNAYCFSGLWLKEIVKDRIVNKKMKSDKF